MQLKRSGQSTSQSYVSSEFDRNSGAGANYKWIKYKPSNGSTDQTIKDTPGPIDWNVGLGANNSSTAFDATGNNGGASKPIDSGDNSLLYNSKKRILTGVFYTGGSIASTNR